MQICNKKQLADIFFCILLNKNSVIFYCDIIWSMFYGFCFMSLYGFMNKHNLSSRSFDDWPDELVKEYNIPMGSIGYLLKKGKDNPNGQIIINIEKVIIRG